MWFGVECRWVARVPGNLPLNQVPVGGTLRKLQGSRQTRQHHWLLARMRLHQHALAAAPQASTMCELSRLQHWEPAPLPPAGGGCAAGGTHRMAGAAAGQAAGRPAGTDQRGLGRRGPRCGAGKLECCGLLLLVGCNQTFVWPRPRQRAMQRLASLLLQ